MTAEEAARQYTMRRWCVVPVPFRSKAPVLIGWPALRLTAETVAEHFNGQPSNIGVLLGEPSGGLLDVDLDCPEAIQFAPVFLPTTHSIFGRASKRRSHWLYLGGPVAPTEKFADVDGPTLVELRATGAQTIFPGSVHVGGEPIEWDEDGECARGDGATLRQAVAELAAACLLARHWPALGSRHEATKAAAGLFAHGGLDLAVGLKIILAASRAAGGDDHRATVLDTYERHGASGPVTGGPTLAGVLRGDGERVVAALRRWLGLQSAAEVPHCTDVGNAQRFVTAHGLAFRFVYDWGTWLCWQGSRWRRDAGELAGLAAKETARSIYVEAAHASDEATRKQLAKWAGYSESEPGIRRMLALAQPDLAIRPEDLDRDPWLLNCPNGTLELRTGHLRGHRREDYITKITNAPYDPAARHPVFDRFLADALPEEDARDYAQRYAGYALTGSTREEVFVFCRGPAGGGKSTFTEGLRRTWGDYATTADFTGFLVKRPSDGPREDVARLAGARLVTSVETRDGQRLAEGLVKLLTGGDTVAARRLYERTFEFVPQFKLLLASNYRPSAHADDDGLWRRLRELPFPTARPRREDRDESVKATLTDPAQAGPAILAWAVAGCGRWLAAGLGEPEVVMAATAEYRRSQEPLADFVADCCLLGSDREVSAHALRTAYDAWCKENGERRPVGGRAWGESLRVLGCAKERRGHENVTYWTGIDLRLGDPLQASGQEPGWVKGE